MKKFLTVLMMLSMVFSMVGCGSSEIDGGDDAGQQEKMNLEALTESAELVLRFEDGNDLTQGDLVNARDLEGANLEVVYSGEVVTGYQLLVEGDACVSAAMWEEDNFRIGPFKNGSCELVIVYGEEKATYPLFVEGLPEALALNWIGYIIYPAGEDGDGVFGTPGLDDDIIVMYNGEPISDYTFTVADESLAEVTKNADGSLHIKALKEGEVLDFLTIEYNGQTHVFGLCV